jgi:hypothetical protein
VNKKCACRVNQRLAAFIRAVRLGGRTDQT